MHVRLAKSADLPCVVRNAREFLAEAPNYKNRKFSKAALIENLTSVMNGSGAFFIVEHNNEPIAGLVCLTTKDWFNNDVIAFEQVFYVAPKYRNTRAPFLLLDAFISWAKHMGANRIQCGTTTGINTKGCLRLYERFGFREHGTLLDMELDHE